MLAVSVMVETHPEFSSTYLEAVRGHAKNCLANEKGCLCFTVHRNKETPNRFFLYEVYKTEEDFTEVHRNTPYLAAHGKLTEPWVKSKEIVIWEALPAEK